MRIIDRTNFPKEILLPPKTLFHKGAVSSLCAECREFGKKGVIVHGASLKNSGMLGRIMSGFSEEQCCFLKSSGEPCLEDVADLIALARSAQAEWIAGIGGGSVLDLAKAAAGLCNAAHPPVYYQDGGCLEAGGIPFIAVPTTAGTGAETTPNSVILNRQKARKLSIRDPKLMARKIILDPGLLSGLPRQIIAYSGMDSLVQAYESFVSLNSTWFSRQLALKAIELINDNIVAAYETSREECLADLLLASYLGGIAFASSRLGVIHGIAHPLGAVYSLPHGLICAVCFKPALELNRKYASERYAQLKDLLGSDPGEKIDFLLDRLKIENPFKGKQLFDKEKVIAETLASGSSAANPKKITAQDVEMILEAIF